MPRSLTVLVAGVFLGAAAYACNGPTHVISAGGEDNFSGPPKPATPSWRLLATHVAKAYPEGRFRRFDEDGEDLLFLTSLLLPARKIMVTPC